MTLGGTLTMTGVVGVIAITIGFTGWLFLTCAILIAMEGTSAMLHSLRLQWVEAQSKYAEFAGHMFTPFKFATLLEEDEGLAEFRG
jgi:V-type H+-transporting ATPase subunit a